MAGGGQLVGKGGDVQGAVGGEASVQHEKDIERTLGSGRWGQGGGPCCLRVVQSDPSCGQVAGLELGDGRADLFDYSKSLVAGDEKIAATETTLRRVGNVGEKRRDVIALQSHVARDIAVSVTK